MELSQDDACALIDIIDKATEGNWPNTASELLEMGHEPEKLCEVVNRVAKVAGRSPIFDPGDF